jgi:hypothetical protein
MANPKTAPYYDVYLQGAKVAAPSLGIEVVSLRLRMTPPMSNAPLLPSRAPCRKAA